MYIPSGIDISPQIIQREMKYRQNVVLTYNCTYPICKSFEYFIEAARITVYNKMMTEQVVYYIEKKLYPQAIQDFVNSKVQGTQFYPYNVNLAYNVTYNQYDLISHYSELKENYGLANELKTRSSYTWNVKNNRIVNLADFFDQDSDYISQIEIEVISQIKDVQDKKQKFFNNYCDLVIEKLNPENYYLTDQGIVVYFQPNEIISSSCGIPQFVVKQS
jgi:hypothetical protein